MKTFLLISMTVLAAAYSSAVRIDHVSTNVRSLLDTTYTNRAGLNVTLSDLSGKYIGLYFSASWCPDCQRYTPQLVKLYNKIHVDKKWEVIWVTYDRDEAHADKYYKEMPWIRLPWSQVAKRGAEMFLLTKQKFIPALTMINPDYEVINPDTPDDAVKYPDQFPWAK